jgi:hypothetical protein
MKLLTDLGFGKVLVTIQNADWEIEEALNNMRNKAKEANVK